MLDNIIDMLSHLLLDSHALSNRMRSGRVDFLSKIEQQIEVPIAKVALLNIFMPTHILFQLLFAGLFSSHRRELGFLYYCEFIVFGRTVGDLHQ